LFLEEAARGLEPLAGRDGQASGELGLGVLGQNSSSGWPEIVPFVPSVPPPTATSESGARRLTSMAG